MNEDTTLLTQKQEVKLMKFLILMGLNKEDTISVAVLLKRKRDALEFMDRASKMNYEMTSQEALRMALEIKTGHQI